MHGGQCLDSLCQISNALVFEVVLGILLDSINHMGFLRLTSLRKAFVRGINDLSLDFGNLNFLYTCLVSGLVDRS